MKRKTDLFYFCVSIFSYLLMSISFLLMPMCQPNGAYGISGILPGVMFWMFLVIGILAQVILCRLYHIWFIKHRRSRSRANKRRIGLLSFFQNIFAFFVDILLVISFIAFMITTIVTDSNGYSCYIFFSLLVFTFCLHCIFNGRIYQYIFGKEIKNKTQKESFVEQEIK